MVLGELDFNQSGGPLLFNHPKGIATDGARVHDGRWQQQSSASMG